jgi:predicted metal-dependent phosphotriesterase family hydrolase
VICPGFVPEQSCLDSRSSHQVFSASKIRRDYIKEKSINELRDMMVREITAGIGDTGIRAGALKGACSALNPKVPFSGDILRVEGVVNLVKAGYAKQIVLPNEVSYKASLRKYGGLGYGHLLENIVPDLKYCGITDEQLHTMLVDNPGRLLSF